MYLNYFKDECSKNGWKNTKAVLSSAEDAELPENYYDLIFARWVIAFVPNPELFLDKLVKSLAPNGTIAFMDYVYEGLSLYPRGAFEKMADAVRAYWRHGGGDPYIGAKIPKMFKERGIELIEYQPVGLAGTPKRCIQGDAGLLADPLFFTPGLEHTTAKMVSSAARRVSADHWTIGSTTAASRDRHVLPRLRTAPPHPLPPRDRRRGAGDPQKSASASWARSCRRRG